MSFDKITNVEKIQNFNQPAIQFSPKKHDSVNYQINYKTQSHSLNYSEKLTKCLKEIYYHLPKLENFIEKDYFYPNIVITGHESSGKNSLLEYFLKMDLFPKNFFNKKVINFS